MQNYDVNAQSHMGGVYTEHIENITAISLNETSYIFWSGSKCVLLIEKERMISFYPSAISYTV